MRLTKNSDWTTQKIEVAGKPYVEPEFVRLPKPKTNCPYTGLSRSKLNQLILPTIENNMLPPVKSVSLRKKGQKKGTRLIVFESLIQYLRSLPS